jgi:tubulin-specific chaperone A
MYTQEAEDQKRKLDKFIANNAEDWDIKNAVRILVRYVSLSAYVRCQHLQRKMLEESHKMIKDSSDRLGNAVGDLRDIVVWSISICIELRHLCLLQVSAKIALAEDEGLQAAEKALMEAEEALELANV